MSQTTHFQYIERPDGIHQFDSHRLDQNHIDLFVDMLDQIYKHAEPNHVVRICIGLHHHNLPHLTYLFQKLRQMLLSRRLDDIPPRRFAIVHHDSMKWLVANEFIQRLPYNEQLEVRFFNHDQLETALQWLNEVQSDNSALSSG